MYNSTDLRQNERQSYLGQFLFCIRILCMVIWKTFCKETTYLILKKNLHRTENLWLILIHLLKEDQHILNLFIHLAELHAAQASVGIWPCSGVHELQACTTKPVSQHMLLILRVVFVFFHWTWKYETSDVTVSNCFNFF